MVEGRRWWRGEEDGGEEREVIQLFNVKAYVNMQVLIY